MAASMEFSLAEYLAVGWVHSMVALTDAWTVALWAVYWAVWLVVR